MEESGGNGTDGGSCGGKNERKMWGLRERKVVSKSGRPG